VSEAKEWIEAEQVLTLRKYTNWFIKKKSLKESAPPIYPYPSFAVIEI